MRLSLLFYPAMKIHDYRHVPVARTFFQRLVGLMGRRGRLFLFIPRCSAVHTWFMRSPIDIAFLDEKSVVLWVEHEAGPWLVFSGPKGTRSVLELPPGSTVSAGDAIETGIRD
ncbi:MAG: DUF192 domain-containing protein [Thermoanaerobaculia bacterium]